MPLSELEEAWEDSDYEMLVTDAAAPDTDLDVDVDVDIDVAGMPMRRSWRSAPTSGSRASRASSASTPPDSSYLPVQSWPGTVLAGMPPRGTERGAGDL